MAKKKKNKENKGYISQLLELANQKNSTGEYVRREIDRRGNIGLQDIKNGRYDDGIKPKSKTGYTYNKLGGRGGSHIGRDSDERQLKYKSLYRDSWEPRENIKNKFNPRNSRKTRGGSNNGYDMGARYKTDDRGLLSVNSKTGKLQETKEYKDYKKAKAKERDKNKNRLVRTIFGAGKQVAAQYGDTIGRVADAADEEANWSRQTAAALNANLAKKKENIFGGKLDKKGVKEKQDVSKYFKEAAERSEKARKQRQEALGKLNKSGTKDIEKAKEGLGTAGQFLIDTLAAGTQFGADTLLSGGTGALRMIAMGGRSYAGGVMEAKEEGADENKAELYGLLSAAREVGTEKIFNVGYMNKIMGNSFAGGKASASLENAAAKVANRFAKSKTGKTALYNSIISSQMMLTEGAEEFIADVIDVPMKRATYKADAEFDLNDALKSGAIGSILGGLGIGGQVSQARSDSKVMQSDEDSRITRRSVKRKDNSSPQSVRSNPKGRSAVHEMINTGLKQDQNTASYRMARQIQDQIDTGQGIIPGQLSALQNHLATNQRESQERMNAARRRAIETYDKDAAEKRTRDNFRSAIANREADAQEFINTREARGGNNYVQSEEAKKNYSITPEVVAANSEAGRYIRTKDKVHASMRNAGVYDEDALNAVTNVVTGYTTDAGDLDMFSPDGSEESMAARATFTAVTGKELPDTAAGTQEVLDEHIGEQTYMNEENNYVGSKMHDMFVAVQAVADDLGDEAGHTLENLMVNNNVPLDEVEQFADAFRQNYTAGALGLSYERTMAASPYLEQYADSSMPKIAYEAGSAVHENEETVQAIKEKERQRKEKQAETKKKTAKKKRKGTFTDKTTDDTISKKQKKILKKLAEAIGVDIVLEDSLTEGGVEANGYYSGGVIHISATSQDPYITVFKHELTHHLQKTAPEEYKALRDFVVREWYNGDAEAVQAAVQAKIEAYRRKGAKLLTPDEAMDEIIADASEEFFRNDETINKVIQANRSLGEKILDWIRSIIADIKALMAEMAEGEYKGKGKFLSDLGILEEAEELWTKALGRSVESDVDAIPMDDIKFSAKKKTKDQTTIKEAIRRAQKKLNKMKPVVNISNIKDMRNMSYAKRTEAIEKEFNKIGKAVDRQGFGVVDLSDKMVNQAMKYLDTAEEIAAFYAIPQVIKKGIVIDSHTNHSGRSYDTVTLGAPILMMGQRANMGVVIKKTKGNRYKMHRLLSPDGTMFVLDKEKVDSQVAGMTNTNDIGEGPARTPTSSKNVPQSSEDSKKKLSLKQDEDYMTAVNAGDMKTAQKMVDEAAKASGYTTVAYHGTDAETIKEFTGNPDVTETNGPSRIKGYFSDSEEYSETYGENVNRYYLNTEKFLGIDGVFTVDEMRKDLEKNGVTDVEFNDEMTDEALEEWFDSWGGELGEDVIDPWLFFNSSGGNLTERIQAAGYNGVEWTEGGMEGEVAYMPFDSQLIKSADPVTYDDKGEVIPLSERFNEKSEDIRFSLQTPVEETRDLIAMHNLWASDLQGILDLGGIPMPSIAITNQEHTNFGDITLLFDKNTIDPARRYNEIYGGDAWTPTFPEIQQKISGSVADRIDEKIKNLLGLEWNAREVARGLDLPSFDTDNIGNAIRSRTPYEAYGNNLGMRIAFIKDTTGTKVRIPMQEAKLHGHEESYWKWVSERMPELTMDDAFGSVEEVMAYEPKLRNVLRAFVEHKYSETDGKLIKLLAKKYDEPMGFADVQNTLIYLVEYRENGMPARVDTDKLKEKLDKLINEKEYEQWIENLFDGIVEKEGLRNDRDIFTPAGNRRSWESLHDPVTLENIVKKMRQELSQGVGIFGGNPRGAAQKRYGSLDEVRADKGRLQMLDDEEYKDIEEKALEKMHKVCDDIANHNRSSRSSYSYFGAVDVGTYVSEVLNRTRNKARIQQILGSEYNLTVTDSQMDDLMDAIQTIAEMPTGYFEAKPQRAVGLDEVKAAIVPRGKTDPELIDRIRAAGAPVYTYDPEVEGDRADTVNQVADYEKIKFSLKDSDGNTLSEGQQEYFRDSTARDAEGNLLVLYHGTPKKGFTVFKDWQYFSANKDYAANYADRNEDNLYKVYANVRKPFDTRIPECREIFENEYMGNYSNTPLQESGLPDWTDGYDLTEFLEENGYDYDAVLLDEGATPSENGEVQERGISYVIRNSDQVKNTDNENPTEDEDIRFSRNTWEEEQAIRRALTQQEKTIDKLQEKVADLRSEFRRTRVATIDEKVMTKDLRAFLKDWGSGAEISDVLESVKEIHKSLLNKESPDWDRAYAVAEDTAKDIINKVSILHDEMYNRYKELRDYLRKARLQLTEKERTEIPDYNDFRKSNMGKINLVNDGRPVDTVYAELAETYPEFFNEDSVNTPGEMVMQMVQVIDSLQPYYETMDADAEQDAVAEVALGLIEFAYDPKLRKTFADRAAERQKAAVEKEKEKGRKRRQTDKEKFKEKIAKIKADRKQAIADLKLTEKQRREKLLKQQRQKVKEVREKARQRATRRSNMNSIKRNAEYLSQALLKPTDTKHIPQQYRTAVATMLSSLDFESVHTDAWIKRYGQPSDRVRGLREMAAAYRQIIRSGEDTYLEDPYFEMLVDSLAEHAQGMRLADMDDALLADMATLVKAIRHNISNANRAFNENIKETISELGNKSIEELEQHKKAGNYGGVVGIINKLFNESNVNPGDFFETIGSETLFNVYQEIRKGFDQHVLNMDEAKERLQSIVDKKQAAAWSEKAKTEKFDLSNGQTIEITPAQKMSLWCLMRRDQARQHILGQGIVLDSVLHKERNVIKKALFGSKTRQQDGTLISFEDVYQIISTVTDEQKKVCRGIMDLMNGTCKQWGNEASMKLYGYEKFNEENYFPIQSAQEWLDSNPTTADQIPKIKSQGMTKAINENANNPIVVGDIFNVVTKHVNDMSMYNTLAVPLTDFERIYNFKQRNENGGLTGKTTKSTLTNYAGERSVKYINQWLKDVNNYREHDTEVIGKISNQLLANYKKATIGFNLRVLVQQPTALMRSLIILDPRDVAKVITQKPAISVIKEMQEHSPLARWKSDGHFETDISRSLRDDLLGKKYLLDRVTMDPYGFADNLAWASMWKAVKNEIHRTRPELERGSDEYWQAVNERFEYVMDRTQVVDSVFHRSQVMRNQNIMLKMISSFMAEPTKTFNMLRTETIKAARQWQAGNKREAAGIFSRVAGIFLLNAAAVSAAAAVIDLLRDAWTGDDDDDDKEQKKWDKFFTYLKNNFAGNANPLAQIVGGNTIFNAIEGFDQENLSTKAISDLAGLIDKWQKFADGDSKFSLFGMVKQTITPLGQLIGVPLKNGEREFESVYRTIVGATSGWNVADYLRAKNFNLNPQSGKSGVKAEFMKYWTRAISSGNEKEAQIIMEDMIKEGVANRDDFTKKLWTEYGSTLKDDVLSGGKKLDKTIDNLTKMGIDEGDIYEKVNDYKYEKLREDIKNKDYDSLKDTMRNMLNQGMSKEVVNEKVIGSVKSKYKEAFEAGDTDTLDQYDKMLKYAGEGDVKHYRYSYARAKGKMEAYNAWQDKGKSEAYKIAYRYLNKYPGIYDSADSMLYGIEGSGDSTKADWRQGIYKVYTKWKWN